MKQITGFYTTCIFLCAISFYKVHAEKGVFSLADSLAANRQFYHALVEVEKTIYLCHDGETQALATLKSIAYYKEMKRFADAQRKAEKAPLSPFIADSIRHEIRYQAALCAYLAGEYKSAGLHLVFLNAECADTMFLAKTYPLQVLTYIQLSDFEKAHSLLAKLVAASELPDSLKNLSKEAAHSLYNKKHLPRMKSEKVAFWIGFVPGLGHVYAGAYKEGGIAFLLNLAALSFGVYEIYNGFYVSGYFLGTGFLNKFYFGAQARRDYLIEQRNQKEINRFVLKNADIMEGL